MNVMRSQRNAVASKRRMRRGMRLAAVLSIGIVAGCDPSDLLLPPGSLTIEPPSTTVPLQTNGGFVLPITISNASETTVYLVGGCGWSVEQSRLMGDEGPREWVRVFSPACSMDLPPGSSRVAIDPGQVLVLTVDTRGGGLGASTVFDGQYRVRLDLAVELGGRFYQLPVEQSVSTAFTVVAS